MKTSSVIGHVGGLAVALGVGAAGVVAGCAVASADVGSSDSSAPAATGAPARSQAHPRPAQGAKTPPTAPRAANSTATGPSPRVRPITAGRRVTPVRTPPPSVAAAPATLTSGPLARSLAANPATNPDAMPPKVSPQEIWVTVASSLVGLAQSGFRAASIAGYLGPTVSTLNQTLVVNGYNLVPSSTELVTSSYGQWTYWPGGPTLVQGQQQYSVVDPATKQSVGTFDALVSTGSPFNVRSKYVELLVTANDGTNVGSGAGQIPPVGSLISTFDLIGGFGWSYSAFPTSPKTAVTFKLTTPFGDIPIPFTFDASKGIADHTVDNRPVDLGNGYSIAPADPTGETYVGTSGFLPYYTTVQAREVFHLRDSSGGTVGSFEGVVTPTEDIMGVYTQAILVTRVIDGSTGTSPGDVPPVGSVFNVMYRGQDDNYVRYVSMPSASGDVISVISVNGAETKNIRTFPMNLLDASALPPVARLPVAGGYSFLPTSPVVPSGVNGLPPREIQVQGYQQFGVYDSAGVQHGSFDADVAAQLDMYGIHSQSVLVTKVTGGTPGTAPGDVPPVGSVFNYVYFGNGGFGTSYSSMPSQSGNKISFKVLTPLVDIPTWSMYNASAGVAGVSFFDPFAGP
jgi:hypothetical protein